VLFDLRAGQRVYDLDADWPTASIRSDGAGAILVPPNARDLLDYALLLRRPGESHWEKQQSLTDGTGNKLLLWPWLLEYGGELDAEKLWVRKLQPLPGKLVARTHPEDLTLRALNHHASCRTKQGLALAFGRDQLQVVFERGGRWSSVDGGPARLRLDPDPVDRPTRFDCVEDNMVASWVEHEQPRADRPLVFQLRQVECGVEGCLSWQQRTELDGLTVPEKRSSGGVGSDAGDAVLGRLGQKRIVVWATRTGFRFRLGSDLAAASRELFLGVPHGAPALFIRGSHAFVFADAGDDQVVGTRIDEDGAVVPLLVAAR
jgi:hypothetical protein